MAKDFEEVAHSGGKITFTMTTDPQRGRGYQQSFSSSRPVPVVLIGVYALLQQGLAVSSVNIGVGIGNSFDPPPMPGCVLVMIASDSQGKFGHHCRTCGGYWRSGPSPNVCPYCRQEAEAHHFLSDAQRRYVSHYCETLGSALMGGEDGDYVIDMDEVADAADREGDRPSFYVSEESQQHKFNCEACDEFNDVIGRFVYCSSCATRNDPQVFRQIMSAVRERLNPQSTGNSVRDAVSAFDNMTGQYAKQLLNLVPMSKRRAARLERGRFQDMREIVDVMKWFDIDLVRGLSASETDFLSRQFLRRHVYEHNGGEVDQIYLDKSGDTTVRLKQYISEPVEDVHRLLGGLDRLTRNLDDGFSELIPPLEQPIKSYQEKLARMEAHRTRRR